MKTIFDDVATALVVITFSLAVVSATVAVLMGAA